MYRLKTGALLLLLIILTSVCAIAGDLSSLFGQMEPIFPEKYDKQLSEMYRLEDRVVFIFRELMVAEYNLSQDQDKTLNGYLKKALNRYWLLESNELKRAVTLDPDYYSRRLGKYVRKLPSTYDQAAFSFLYSSIAGKPAKILLLADSSAKAMDCLKEAAHQKAYVAAIKISPDFYRRIPLFVRPLKKLDDKIDALVEKLQQKFLLEKMILAVDSLSRSKSGKLAAALLKLKSKLNEKLVRRMVSNLEVQLETGLESDAVTGIMKSPQGVIVKQTLYQGRIRTFVKEMQKAETLLQLNCFTTIMRTMRQEFAKLKRSVKLDISRETLAKMDKNFDQMQTIMRLKLRRSTKDSLEFEKLVNDFDREISSAEATVLVEAL